MTLADLSNNRSHQDHRVGPLGEEEEACGVAKAEGGFAVHLRGTQGLFVGGGIELGSSCKAVNPGMLEAGLGSGLGIHPPPYTALSGAGILELSALTGKGVWPLTDPEKVL